MSGSQAYIHLLMLSAWWWAAMSLMRLRAGTGTCNRVRECRFAMAWWSSAAPVLLWLGQALGQHPRPSVGVALGVWVAGWLGLRSVVRIRALGSASAGGLLAVWLVTGGGLGLLADVARSSARDWLLVHAACAGLVAGGIFVGVLVRQRLPHAADLYRGPTAATAAVVVIIGAALSAGIPVLRNGVWALAMAGYIVAVAHASGRTAATRAVPANARQWVSLWQWPILMAAIPTAVLLLPLGRRPDFAPAGVLGLALLAAFWAVGQRRAALLLFAAAMGLAACAYRASVPGVLVERVHAVMSPTDATSDQQLQALWAVSRGGLYGRGSGRWINVDGESAAHRAARPPVVPLAPTDSVWAVTTETLGVLGATAILATAGVICVWLWQGSSRAADPYCAAFFAAVFCVFAASEAATAAWVAGVAPVAGLAAPLLSGGFWNGALWAGLFALSVALYPPAPTEVAPNGPAWRRTQRPGSLHAALPLVVAAIGFGCVTTGLLCHGVWRREPTLSMIFLDRQNEAWARKAVFRGWVRTGSGAVCVPGDAGMHPAMAYRLHRMVEEGAFKAGAQGRIVVRPEVFRRGEPSGLGTVVRLLGSGDE